MYGYYERKENIFLFSKRKMENQFLWVTLGIVGIILSVGLILYFLYKFVRVYLKRNVDIAIFADIPLSMKEDRIFINCINMDKHREYWEGNESNLQLYGMGMIMPTRFYRVPEIPNGYRIEFTRPLSNKETLALTGSVKYNRFVMSKDNGETTIKINSINDDEAKRAISKMQKGIEKDVDYLKKEIIRKIHNSIKYSYVENELREDGIVSYVDEVKATVDSFRFQAIIPKDNELITNGFNPEELSLYHIYHGKMYRLETKFLNKASDLFEWEVIGLEAGTVYAGLTVSTDAGKTFIPSSSLYATTREEDGQFPDVSNAILGKPTTDDKPLPMWKYDKSLSTNEKKIMKKSCDILVKKHFEEKQPEDFLPLNKVQYAYEYYEWIPFKLEELEKELEKETK